MPFTARCVRCGYVVMANTRKMLDILMDEHDSQSHKGLDEVWNITVITHIDYAMLVKASKLSAFWNAINRKPK